MRLISMTGLPATVWLVFAAACGGSSGDTDPTASPTVLGRVEDLLLSGSTGAEIRDLQIQFARIDAAEDPTLPDRLYWRRSGDVLRIDAIFDADRIGVPSGYVALSDRASAYAPSADIECNWSANVQAMISAACVSGASGFPATDWIYALTHGQVLRDLPPETIAGYAAGCYEIDGLAAANQNKLCIAAELGAPVFIGALNGTGYTATAVEPLDGSPITPEVMVSDARQTVAVASLRLPGGYRPFPDP
jgi:hypothetical protein